jgi:hypothetical protein
VSEDWTRDAKTARWISHVRHQVLPMIEHSAVSAIIAPSAEPDIKVAVELGLSILLDKPLAVIVAPGVHCPRALRRAADRVFEGPAAVTAEAMRAWMEQIR